MYNVGLFDAHAVIAQGIDTTRSTQNRGLYSVSSFSPDFNFITVKIRPDESGKHHNWEHYYINQKGNAGFRFVQMVGRKKNNHWGYPHKKPVSRFGLQTISEKGKIRREEVRGFSYNSFFAVETLV
mgnify:CR=1 FL=1